MISGNGKLDLDLADGHTIFAFAGEGGRTLYNPVPRDSEETYLIDSSPQIINIVRHSPEVEMTTTNTVVFRVTFSEAVQHVDAADFRVVAGAGLTQTGELTVVAEDDTNYLVEVPGLGGKGSLDLDLAVGQNIADLTGNTLEDQGPVLEDEQTYTVNTISPRLISIHRHDPSQEVTNNNSVTFRVLFNKAVENISPDNFTTSGEASGEADIITISPEGSSQTAYHVNVSEINGEGVLNLDPVYTEDGPFLAPSDLMGPDSKQAYIIDTTAPVIELEGENPQIIELGTGYKELGAFTDDGTVVNIDVSGFADAIGSYDIIYTAVDAAGNEATANDQKGGSDNELPYERAVCRQFPLTGFRGDLYG